MCVPRFADLSGNGVESNRMERTKAKDILSRLNRQRGSKAEEIVLDEEDTEAQMHKFWKDLGGKPTPMSAAGSFSFFWSMNFRGWR